MKYMSEFMNMVKKREEYRLAKIFQSFLMFYGALLMLISLYYWIIKSKIEPVIYLFIIIGIFLFLSGFFWYLLMRNNEFYKKFLESEKKRFYSEIVD